jgi:polynucleotide 5'-kinase involved in rRNA processing
MTANSHQLSSLFEQAVSIAILPINNTSSVPFSQCCHKSAPARPEYAIVALGLTNAGKSTMLAILANEETSGIEPTQGLYTSVQSIKK